MALALGVDTGGTYTDAVLIADDKTIVAEAKSLTTRGDLAQGIAASIDAVLSQSGAEPSDIGFVSLSTTLATNALVEGQGGRIGLVFIGFSERDLARQGLGDALAGDPVLLLAGGHDHTGSQANPLDIEALTTWLAEHGDQVSGFAVAAQFAVRNPAHEIAARDQIRAQTDRPVSCSHELSARLGGPKRATTAVLNARLIGMIDSLISACEGLLQGREITAPLMVVRGDGALIAAHVARQKPIETILSGPAASLVGAAWLTGEKHALVSDIGGTTTDIALLSEGRPRIDPDGAQVGGLHTMVEAVALRTYGLGGDSAVHMAQDSFNANLTLGPRRLIPISMLAHAYPDILHNTLDAQLKENRSNEHDARFVLRVNAQTEATGLAPREANLLARMNEAPVPLSDIIASRMDLSAIDNLRARDLVQIAGVTPTDAAHVMGLQSGFDQSAAEKALALLARQKTGSGEALAQSAPELAERIIARLHHQTAETLLETGLAEDGLDKPEKLVAQLLTQRAMRGKSGIVSQNIGLSVPVIGLGASAATYYPRVGEKLGCTMLLPKAGGVANAIGAVVGQITLKSQISITSPTEGLFLVHSGVEPERFTNQDQALAHANSILTNALKTQAKTGGADSVSITTTADIKTSRIESRTVFIEATISGEATGRPRVGT